MKRKYFWTVFFVLAFGLSVWAASQVADKAVDPVCGMSVVKEGAKWTFDYKDTTYYFCSEGCKTSFAKEPEKYLAKAVAKAAEKAKIAEAKTTEGDCAGCANMAAEARKAEPMKMGGGMGMMGGQMQGHMQGQMAGHQCPCCMMMMHGQMGMMGGQMMGQMPQPAADPTKAIDPVSGKSIVKEGAKWKSDYKGTTYYFCCENAKTKFDKEPDVYLAKLAETQKAEQMKMGGMMGGMMGGQMMGQIPQPAADPTKAIDPVSGKSIVKEGAKWKSDYKGTTYYFCCENAKTKFDKEPDVYLAKLAETQKADQMKMMGHMGMMGGQMMGQMPQPAADPTKAIDPVSGKAIVKEGAKWKSDYKGTTYYFCCENAKTKFDKEPDVYLAKLAETQKAEQMKMSGMMGGQMQGQMAGHQCAGCMMMMKMHGQMPMPPAPPAPPMAPGMGMSPRHMMRAPMMRMMRGMMGERMPGMMGMMGMMEGVDRKVENTKDGAVITLTSKDPEMVKKIQEHLAKMLEREVKMKERMAKMKEAAAEAKKEKK